MRELIDLKDFSITNWYENFKNVCLETVTITIPPVLLEKFRNDDSNFEITEVCSDDFIKKLENLIGNMGKKVFIKNNWHAPVDAKFMCLGNDLNVTNSEELLSVMFYSDILLKDFENTAYKDYCISVRKWINIHPASEFRCLVINDILWGITPRDWPTFYGHYVQDGQNIISSISTFFKNHIQKKFNRKTYTFDVILSDPNSIQLVDFGLLNSKSNLYAFSWKELEDVIKKNIQHEVSPVFRYLSEDIGIMSKTDAVHKFVTSLNST